MVGSRNNVQWSKSTGLDLYSTGPYSEFVERCRSFGKSTPYLVLAKQPAGIYPHVPTPELWIGVQVAGRGATTFELGGGQHSSTIEPGDVLLRRPNAASCYEFDHTHTFLLLSIPLTDELLELGRAGGAEGLNFGLLHKRKIAEPFISSVVRQVWYSLQTESVDPLQYLPVVARHLVVELLAVMHRANQKSIGGLSGPTKKRVMEFIHFNLDQPITVADLARLSELSEFHFLRAFRQSFSLTPHRYIVRQRIEKAKELLTMSNVLLDDVAKLVGYTSSETLSRAFKAEGLPPPHQFRKLR